MLIDTILHYSQQDHSHNMDTITLALTLAVRFQVDNVARYVHDHYNSGKFLRVQDEIPNIAPLASPMWFEYGGQAVNHPALEQFGCLITVDYDSKEGHVSKWEGIDVPDNIRWVLRAEYFGRIFPGITRSDWVYFIKVGEDGQPLGMGELQNYGDFTPDEKQRSVWHEEITVALTSICFSHCKNTEIKRHQPSRQVRRAAERAEKPVFNFHTIDIQPSTRILRTEGQIDKNGLAKALHICRGHFAHYTAEHPLFGKYTGTFYRPMHVRGSVEQGIAAKDYRVHP